MRLGSIGTKKDDFMYIKDMKWLEKALLMDSVYKNKKVVDCGLQVCYNIRNAR